MSTRFIDAPTNLHSNSTKEAVRSDPFKNFRKSRISVLKIYLSSSLFVFNSVFDTLIYTLFLKADRAASKFQETHEYCIKKISLSSVSRTSDNVFSARPYVGKMEFRSGRDVRRSIFYEWCSDIDSACTTPPSPAT